VTLFPWEALRSRAGERRGDAMARLFCEHCQKESNFLPIYLATKVEGVSRSTIYYWIERGWVHCRQLPSGRRVICEASRSRPANPASDLAPNPVPPKKPSKSVPPPRHS
jgi:hypothetical protein